MTKPPTDFGASARARLLALTRSRKGEFQLTLQRYAAERFLYRLGRSPYRGKFVLKGAMLFVLWDEATAIRSTRDLDLAGYWANDAASLGAAFREICTIADPTDGIAFDLDTFGIVPIRDAAEYHGFRITLDAKLAGAVIPFQVDVGFGDAIVPEPVDVLYPTLLEGEAPSVRAYPREAVIAEKFHAMVSLADANTRFKDFYDILALSSRFAFEGPVLVSSLAATFARRASTSFSPWPVALTGAFYADDARASQWQRFLKRGNLPQGLEDFQQVGRALSAFLDGPVRALANGEPFTAKWPPQGPWYLERAA